MKNFLLLLTISFSFTIYAQYEAAHWFFGDHAGLDFSGGSNPVPEPGSQIVTEEGCSSISTPCGDLVLYTDGETVWNANHQVMVNGTGLLGDYSSTQSGIVIPKPFDDTVYYIFTVDDAYNDPSTSGMCYSKVDMTLGGGLGGVDTNEKNVNLVQHASEKVTAVASDDGSYIWVITFAPVSSSTTAPYANSIYGNYNTFYAFKVTNAGVNPVAVVSTVNVSVSTGAGYMKVSPDGSKLAIANMNDGNAYIMDFDITTGVVSNPQLLHNNFSANEPYGLEFSPDSSKLYISNRNDRLVQYDINNNNSALLISSQPNFRSALQLGIDGKIYQTHTTGYTQGTNRMSYIDSPNELGTACNYNYLGITLPSGMVCHQGLPPFIQSFFSQINAPNPTTDVLNAFEITANAAINSVDWDFGDGTTLTTYPDNPPLNNHTIAEHMYTTSGTYIITATVHLSSNCDVTVQKTVNIPPSIGDQFFCLETSGQIQQNLHDFDSLVVATQFSQGPFNITYYTSKNDAINEVNPIIDPFVSSNQDNVIYYIVEDIGSGIKYLGKFHLFTSPTPIVETLAPIEICDTDDDGIAVMDMTDKKNEILAIQNNNQSYEVKFYPTQADAEAYTNEITDTANYTNNNPFNETIWYNITDLNSGCNAQGSFDLIVYPLVQIDMEDQYIICEGSTIQVEAPAGFEQYEWSTGDTTQDVIINSAGQYTITVTDSHGCSNSKDITVIPSNPATIEQIEITDFKIGSNNSLEVTVTGLGNYEYSLDGINYQQSNVFYGLYPGTYTVYISDKNGCGVTEKEVDILGAPQFFTPNGDGFNDHWQIINVTKRPGTMVNIYDRYGKLIASINSAGPGWDGTYNGKPAIATDYWYIAHVKELDGNFRKVKGHFTLKR